MEEERSSSSSRQHDYLSDQPPEGTSDSLLTQIHQFDYNHPVASIQSIRVNPYQKKWIVKAILLIAFLVAAIVYATVLPKALQIIVIPVLSMCTLFLVMEYYRKRSDALGL